VRERRYTGPEETVEPGLLHEPAAGATDSEGMTAEEAAAVDAVDGSELTQQNGEAAAEAASQEQTGSTGEGASGAEAEPDDAPA
jgi:hypothetical protein